MGWKIFGEVVIGDGSGFSGSKVVDFWGIGKYFEVDAGHFSGFDGHSAITTF